MSLCDLVEVYFGSTWQFARVVEVSPDEETYRLRLLSDSRELFLPADTVHDFAGEPARRPLDPMSKMLLRRQRLPCAPSR